MSLWITALLFWTSWNTDIFVEWEWKFACSSQKIFQELEQMTGVVAAVVELWRHMTKYLLPRTGPIWFPKQREVYFKQPKLRCHLVLKWQKLKHVIIPCIFNEDAINFKSMATPVSCNRDGVTSFMNNTRINIVVLCLITCQDTDKHAYDVSAQMSEIWWKYSQFYLIIYSGIYRGNVLLPQ